MTLNVNFNILLGKYIVHPFVKIKKDFDNVCLVLRKHTTLLTCI